jgi:hypothetical protein
MLGDDSSLAPPESISNSEVKRTCADDSVGFPHVKVGYRQALFFITFLISNQFFLGDDSSLAPPESISNSEVKRTCADDSVGFPHVKVGYRQDSFL